MDRMKIGVWRRSAPVAELGSVLVWTLRRYGKAFDRRYGAWGWVNIVLLSALLAGGAWVLWHGDVLANQQKAWAALEATKASQRGAPTQVRSVTGPSAARRDLKAFDQQLLAQRSVPQAIQDLLRSAEDQGLLIERGDYDSQVEAQGGFVRVRMNLPVKGKAQAVHRFIRTALLQQPQLALEGIRFKREGVQTGTIEAQLNWVLFTRLSEEPVPSGSPGRRTPGEGA